MKFQNPVLRGMYPDPSMCAANGKYYMVCSTFSYFPGVPLFESDDLINWKQIGHCLTRKSQLLLENSSTTGGGIYAPTIRFNNGRFYMVVTNVSNIGNFYVWTDDIYGEWSDPIKVEQDGIDPSLFFDDDGKVYFISNGNDKTGRGYIQISQIDIETGKKLSENEPLWYGTGGRYIEAPHMYKFNGYYYLLNAEGGTEYGHMVNYARSKNLKGPFEPCPANPVLTNRNLGGYQLQGAGHGDIVQATDGTWWFCHLAFRQIDKYMPFHHLGRETCMEPVIWKDDWFYIGTPCCDLFDKQGYGEALLEVELPFEHEFKQQDFNYHKTFQNLTTKNDWNFLRNPHEENYEFGKDFLKIKATNKTTKNLEDSPSWVGIRQCAFEEEISCQVELSKSENVEKTKDSIAEAGLSLFMDENHHYDIFITKEENDFYVSSRLCIGQAESVKEKIKLETNKASFKIFANAYCYQLFLQTEKDLILLSQADTRYLSSEVAGGFTGVYLGFYAVDSDSSSVATFTNLSVKNK